MKIKVIYGLLLAFLFFPNTIWAQKETLEIKECMEIIDSLWPTKQNITLNQELLDYQIKNAKNVWKPDLVLNAQATYQSSTIELDIELPAGNLEIPTPDKDQYKVFLDARQMIWDGGLSKAQQELYKTQITAKNISAEIDIKKAKKQVTELFFAILQVQLSEKIIEETVLEINRRIKIVKSAVKNGMSSSIQLEKLELQVLKLEQSQHEIQSSKVALLKSLNQLLLGNQITASTLLYLPEIETTTSQLANTANYRLMYSGINQLSAQKDLLQKTRNPKIMSFAQAGYGKPGLNMLSNAFEPYFIVGLNAQWKIWDFSYKNKKQLIDIQQKTIENSTKSYLSYLSASEQKLMEDMDKYDFLIQKDKEIVEKQTGILKKSSLQLDKGIISASVYLEELFTQAQVKLNLEMHNLQKIKSKVDYNTLNEIYQY